MNPPSATPPPAPPSSRSGSRLLLVIGGIAVLACLGLLCIGAVAAVAISRFGPGSAPTPQAFATNLPPLRATPGTSFVLPTLGPCPTQTPVQVGGSAGQPTSAGPQAPAAPVPCASVAPVPATTTARAGRTPLPTLAFSGSCARPARASPAPSPYVVSITLAEDVQGDAKDPVNPTRQFSANSIFHAVAAIQDAPANTRFKATWYATDVGSAASCNSLIDSFELTSDGTRNVDFNLTPNSRWPAGLYRVELFVNANLDSVTDFTVK